MNVMAATFSTFELYRDTIKSALQVLLTLLRCNLHRSNDILGQDICQLGGSARDTGARRGTTRRFLLPAALTRWKQKVKAAKDDASTPQAAIRRTIGTRNVGSSSRFLPLGLKYDHRSRKPEV